ncbi:MAG: hypothetical protein K2X66_18395, partial [Cyanobacteria bacterium]|nr:hypothetical protein [Cyanobacteriota bacterium]
APGFLPIRPAPVGPLINGFSTIATANLSNLPSVDRKTQWVSQLVGTDGASSCFIERVKNLLVQDVPEEILSDLVASGYRLSLRHHITENRSDLENTQFILNERGGLNEPLFKRVTIGEWVNQIGASPPIWLKNLYWENAVIHELGHALGDIWAKRLTDNSTDPAMANDLKAELLGWGASELPAFKTPWFEDYNLMPETIKTPNQGFTSPLAYYLNDNFDNRFHVGRRETFAEMFDVLIRGTRSSYNYDLFNQYFPNAKAAMKQLLKSQYNLNPSGWG